MADIDLAPGVHVPPSALEYRSARAGGPGGQNVNKVETKVELRVNPAAIVGLTPGARLRLAALAGHWLMPDGTIVITAQETRHQFTNKQIALEKLMALVVSAIPPPKIRRATKPSRGATERRIESKKKDGDKKKGRGRVDSD